jgi:hypothetical protein
MADTVDLKSPEVATQPITRQEFMNIISQYRNDPFFSRLPLPDFAYQELPEYKNTEMSRIGENYDYQKKQASAKTPEEREQNMRERLKRKLEAKQK